MCNHSTNRTVYVWFGINFSLIYNQLACTGVVLSVDNCPPRDPGKFPLGFSPCSHPLGYYCYPVVLLYSLCDFFFLDVWCMVCGETLCGPCLFGCCIANAWLHSVAPSPACLPRRSGATLVSLSLFVCILVSLSFGAFHWCCHFSRCCLVVFLKSPWSFERYELMAFWFTLGSTASKFDGFRGLPCSALGYFSR